MSVKGLEESEKIAKELERNVLKSLKKQKTELKDQLAKTKFLLGDPDALKGWRTQLADSSRVEALLSMMDDVEKLYLSAGDTEAARLFKRRMQASLKTRLTNLKANELEVKIRAERLRAETRERMLASFNQVRQDAVMRELYAQSREAGGCLSGIFGKPFMRDLITLETKAAGSKTLGTYMENLYNAYEEGLKNVFISGIIRGDSYKTMEQNLMKATDITAGKADLLITTEANAIMNDSVKQVIDSNPLVKGYRFRAVLDSRTSKICQEHDGEYIPKDEAKPGVNYPPLHPRCRSTVTTVLVTEDEKKDTMQRYTKNGSNAWIKVPPGTTYKEFRRMFDDFIQYSPTDRHDAARELYIPANDPRIVRMGSLEVVPNVAASASLLDNRLPSNFSSAAQEAYDRAIREEPRITRMLEDQAKEDGASMAGIEFSVKTASSVAEKISKQMRKYGVATDAEAIDSMGDIVRYTYVTDHDSIPSSAKALVKKLQDGGVDVVEVDNKYLVKDGAYKGVHINAISNGQKFELQVHSQESLNVKNTTHLLYTRARKLPEGSEERVAIEDQMKKLASSLRDPKGIDTLESFNKSVVSSSATSQAEQNALEARTSADLARMRDQIDRILAQRGEE